MTGDATLTEYQAEPAAERIVVPLDAMTLIYQRRSGITHIVAEPVPEILAAMGADVVNAALLSARLASRFDLDETGDVLRVIAARLAELADLGLVEVIARA